VLAANSADITGTTLTTVMTITGVGVGRYTFKCQLIFQTTATTTGIQVAVNHTGTTTQFAVLNRWVDTLATATTGGVTGAGAVAAGNVHGSHSTRTKNVGIGAVNVSVDAANADTIMTIEGFMVVSVSGSLEIKLAAELAALVCRAMQGSFLELKKLS
jgi:stage V sporulation protein SpoVS